MKLGAELGYDIAKCSVARCYEMGNGVLQNSPKALEIYRNLSQVNDSYFLVAIRFNTILF
eukprot:m.297555 g.297555  ORF g.297555 m.297555 type:complete len:60 (+) comp16400_c0_seq23:1557-1736(+)